MTILLLGGFGFIGTNILKFAETLDSDYRMIVFDRFPNHLDNIHFERVDKVYAGDFSDEYLLNKIFTENRIDVVLHSLSASVPSSSVDNIFDLKFNVIPTITLLNVMKAHDVENIMFISSGGAVYGDNTVKGDGHSEDDVLYPKSAYGVSKLVIEKYLYLYSTLYGFKVLIIRLSNPYGPYHYSQKQGVVNIALEKAMRGEKLEIWGDGNGKKDYIFITDFCKILYALIDSATYQYEVLNIGSGNLLSVNNIADTIKNKLVSTFEWDYRQVNNLDVSSFKLDLSKLHKILGDFTFTSFDEGLNLTYEWYRNK